MYYFKCKEKKLFSISVDIITIISGFLMQVRSGCSPFLIDKKSDTSDTQQSEQQVIV